ncbi:hypothetical protein ACKGJN_09440 [Gillisia sp. Q332]|uniref:hypothetical protein n=1 Tax=Gillisia xinjiangensis TaxID=3384765 RepID=UPI00391E013C
MLHKKSTSNNLWKMTAVLPLVLAFLLVFNVKTVAQVIPSEAKTELTRTEKFSASISENSSPEDLDFAKNFMLKQNLVLEYEDISRTPEGLLTSITVNFLNKINNNSGSVSKNDPDGIGSFVIFVNKNGETGVADAPVFSNEIKTSTDKVLAEIGLNPLFIINKKEYQAAQLYGKSIHLKSGFVFISPNEAEEIKKYGTKAQDGIILVAEGEIIADFSEEMKKLDHENKKTTLNYLQIDEGNKPTFITVKKNQKNLEKSQTNKNKSSEKDEKQEKEDKKDTLNTNKNGIKMVIGTGARFEADKPGIGTILARDSDDIYAYQNSTKSNPASMNFYLQEGKPLLVVDGEIKEAEFELNSIKTDEIASVTVLKGENAVKKYGKDAENGVIELTTKKVDFENSSKIFEIKSSFSDAQLDSLKEAAKQQTNFKLNFKNIKRNSAGLISAIDVSLNGKGQKASASYKVEDGVPTIYVGEKKDGGVIVTSSPLK